MMSLQVIGEVQGRPVAIKKTNAAESEENKVLQLELSR